MPSRRQFLASLAGGIAATRAVSASATWASPLIDSSLNGPIGLQLWSLRAYLPKDVPGTLTRAKAMGFTEVEGAGLWGQTAAGLRAALDAASLSCRSAHMGYERLRDDLQGALAEARALGATEVICPWIPHDAGFTREVTLRAADMFNRAGTAAWTEGLRFAYHSHGYEFVPSTEGTLFDTFLAAADPKTVGIQVDVFHTYHGGGDPVRVIERLGARATSLHLKDLKKGVPVVAGAGTGTPDMDVPVGSGQIDMAAVLVAARKAGTARYYVEDESATPLENIPKSVAWLQAFRYPKAG